MMKSRKRSSSSYELGPRSTTKLRIARNLAVRWLKEHPTTGIDPDLCGLAPPPDGFDELGSLCLWQEGHTAPPLCFEIVSAGRPYKDYVALQDRYASMGTHELVVFDPLLAGPKSLGGPVALQLWRRDATRAFERVHFRPRARLFRGLGCLGDRGGASAAHRRRQGGQEALAQRSSARARRRSEGAS